MALSVFFTVCYYIRIKSGAANNLGHHVLLAFTLHIINKAEISKSVLPSLRQSAADPPHQLARQPHSDSCLLWLPNGHLTLINHVMYEMSRQVNSDIFIPVCVCPHRVGHNEIIGVMRVGCSAEGLGRDHWNEMLAYPRKPIAHWHPLLEPKKSEKEVSLRMDYSAHVYDLGWEIREPA